MNYFKKFGLAVYAMLMLFVASLTTNSYASVDFSEDAPSARKDAEQSRSQPQQKASGAVTTNKKIKLAENNPIAGLLCKAIRAFTGTVSKIIAVILIMGLGVVLLQATPTSPVSPVTIVSFIIGIGIFFSAEFMIGKLMGDAGYGGDAGKACDCKYGVGNCDV